jgi:hypothetical protein
MMIRSRPLGCSGIASIRWSEDRWSEDRSRWRRRGRTRHGNIGLINESPLKGYVCGASDKPGQPKEKPQSVKCQLNWGLVQVRRLVGASYRGLRFPLGIISGHPARPICYHQQRRFAVARGSLRQQKAPLKDGAKFVSREADTTDSLLTSLLGRARRCGCFQAAPTPRCRTAVPGCTAESQPALQRVTRMHSSASRRI